MRKNTVWKAFRCTKEQGDEIAKLAAENNLSQSEYIRRKVFWLPPDTMLALKQLRESERKIGVNINQVVRSCNSKHFVSSQDYKDLKKYLVEINEKYEDLLKELKRQSQTRFQKEMLSNKYNSDSETSTNK